MRDLVGLMDAGGAVHGNIGAAICKPERNGASDTAAGSGHKGRPAGNVEQSTSPSCLRRLTHALGFQVKGYEDRQLGAVRQMG